MRTIKSRFVALCVAVLLPFALAAQTPDVHVDVEPSESNECVILLHGLARTASSMSSLGVALNKEGFTVVKVDYPSRKHRVETLSESAVSAGIASCSEQGSQSINFVTHSMGGILVRDYLSRQSIADLSRVVMLAPPNHGSAVVDNLKDVPGVLWLNGPAFLQLGTDKESLPLSLGRIEVDTAIIAGTESINLFLSNYLENPDDGKVSVESARLEGMCAMLLVPVSHPYIMQDESVIEQTIAYLQTGQFTIESAEYFDCVE